MNTSPTGARLTNDDTLKVVVRYRYIVAARMLYRDYCGTAKVANQQLYTIQQQDLQIKSLNKQTIQLTNAKNQCDSISTKQAALLANAEIEKAKLSWQLKGNQAKKIGLGIAVPAAAILSFLLGWYLHR